MDTYEQTMVNIQKLTAALYRVTELMSDKEPIKWLLRNKAVGIYDNFMSIKFKKDKENILNTIMDSLPSLINILDLASSGASIANLNFQILKREYLNLRSFIEGKKDDIAPEIKLIPQFSIGHHIGQPIGQEQKEELPEKPEQGLKIKNNERPACTGRKERILEFLKTGEPRTISEIASIFSDLSEKSIQRDLLELVKSGKVKASGEKRWRRYSLTENKI